jgi:hypothetical protein
LSLARRVARRYPVAGLLLALGAAGCGSNDGATVSTAPAPPPAHRLVVGSVEDAGKAGDGARKAELMRSAGFRAVVLSAVWTPPLTRPTDPELTALRGAVEAAADAGVRPIVAVYAFGSATPLDAEARGQFAAFAASIPRELPRVRTVSIGNEPNLGLFWSPQFAPDGSDAAAPAYEALLAEAYDAVKAVSADITVIGGSLAARGNVDPQGRRQTQSPTRFLRDLGAAYRASGRDRPLMDMLSIHPYPESSSVPPDLAHPRSTSIGIADYGKLVDLLDEAFGGTAQPGGSLPVVYGEYGIQTVIPPAEAPAYSGAEPPSTKAVDEATQARYYAQAIRLAFCQPTVAMLLFFHSFDEPQLERLQTGVYYADLQPKSSRDPVAEAALAAGAGRLECRS